MNARKLLGLGLGLLTVLALAFPALAQDVTPRRYLGIPWGARYAGHGG